MYNRVHREGVGVVQGLVRVMVVAVPRICGRRRGRRRRIRCRIGSGWRVAVVVPVLTELVVRVVG